MKKYTTIRTKKSYFRNIFFQEKIRYKDAPFQVSKCFLIQNINYELFEIKEFRKLNNIKEACDIRKFPFTFSDCNKNC